MNCLNKPNSSILVIIQDIHFWGGGLDTGSVTGTKGDFPKENKENTTRINV